VIVVIRLSSIGRRLAAILDNENLASSLRQRVYYYKELAFALSGSIAAVGGVLFLYQEHSVVPDSFTVLVAIQFVIMIVLGGRGVVGAAVGVLIVEYIPQVLGLGPLATEIASGAVLIGVILVLPRGVMPSIYGAAARIQRRKPSPGTATAATGMPDGNVANPAEARSSGVTNERG
jgi:branched-chain amino acid transport system permease protein